MITLHRELELDYDEAKLTNHILKRLHFEIQDYMELRQVQTPEKLYEVAQIFCERYKVKYREQRFSPRQYAGYAKDNRDWQEQRQRYEQRKQPRTQQSTLPNNNLHRGQMQKETQSQATKPWVTVSAVSIMATNLPRINIIVNGIVFTALFDTGSGISIISEKCFFKYFRFMKYEPAKVQARDAQNRVIPARGKIALTVEVRKHKCQWDFVILKNVPQAVIIGEDFMSEFKLQLDFANRELHILKESKEEPEREREPIAVEWKNTRLNERQKLQLVELLNSFSSLFSDKPGRTDVVFHEIKTNTDKPVASKPYRYDKPRQNIIEYHVLKMLKEGIIMPIESPYAAPIVLCRKKNDKPKEDPEAWRFAVDYRKLNAVTACPQYPLPHIDELIANLPTTKFMTSLDLTAGYHQVPVHPDSIPKTAFITGKSIYAFKMMPFGLAGAPATFQRLMDFILKDSLGKNVFVYLDDILIVSETFDDHVQHLREVFTAVERAGMTIKLAKCAFAREELKYLGYNITPEGIKADSSKFEAIRNMPAPKNCKQLASFLGLVGWYQKFIPNFADICEPLYALKRKRVKFVWSTKAQEAFDQLKEVLISDRVILSTPDYSSQLEVWTDASAVGIGAVLAQEGRPIAFASRSMKQAERNYSICDREALAVIYALEKFRPYFNGLPVKVVTDHSALTKLTNGKNLSPRMIRWALRLAEFNIEIEHREGKQNVVADGLSRIPIEGKKDENDEPKCRMITSTVIEDLEKFKYEQKNDPEMGIIYKYLEDPETFPLGNEVLCVQRSHHFKLIDGLLFYTKKLNSRDEIRVFVPQSLRKNILEEHHDNPLAGHLGIKKTLARLQEVCYFPQMRKVVTGYVSSCDTCQRFNYKNILPAGKLIPIQVKNPLEIVGMDLIGPYPASNPERYRYVLVITDYFSKWTELVPLRKASAEGVTKAFVETFITRYGVPLQVVSDNGVQFVSTIFEQMCHQLDIKHVKTVPYRPQSNQAERVNRNLVQMIAAYVKNCHTHWDRYLNHFAYALRTAIHETTKKTPAELFLGRKIMTPFHRLILTKGEQEAGMASKLDQVIREARIVINKAQKQQEMYYNMRRRELIIKVGDYILLQNHRISSAPNKVVGKFCPKYIGPYKVLAVKQNNIWIEKDGRTVPVNIDQVRVYKFRTDSLCSGDTEETSTAPSIPSIDSETLTAADSESQTLMDDPRLPRRVSGAVPALQDTLTDPRKVPDNRGTRRRKQNDLAGWKREEPKRTPPTISTERRQVHKKHRKEFGRGQVRPPSSLSTDQQREAKRPAGRRKDRRCPGDKRNLTETTVSGRPEGKRQQVERCEHPYRTRLQARQQEESRGHTAKVQSSRDRQFLEWCWEKKQDRQPSQSLQLTDSSSTL